MEKLESMGDLVPVIILTSFFLLQDLNDNYNNGLNIKSKFVKILIGLRRLNENFVAYLTIEDKS